MLGSYQSEKIKEYRIEPELNNDENSLPIEMEKWAVDSDSTNIFRKIKLKGGTCTEGYPLRSRMTKGEEVEDSAGTKEKDGMQKDPVATTDARTGKRKAKGISSMEELGNEIATTDASDIGCGANFGSLTIGGPWSETESQYHINWKELKVAREIWIVCLSRGIRPIADYITGASYFMPFLGVIGIGLGGHL
ncbi:uncharacterized protein VTP21DRAFT_5934 [Calcarisporiella thermophila]|uniref:uncharacterized protein n=1 Tax=Calcarisporiella thermophila TaxID=911321 RepID=UPI0037423D6D